LKSKDIILSSVCPTLKYCLVTSEMLFESDKLLLETYLGVPVVNEYGAAELDLIAFTNKEGDLIVNSETLFVEILDDQDKPVEHGQSGRIIITSLYNKAHPMIRYDIGDTGTLSEKSTYKKPILAELTGRTNDVAKLPSGKVVPGLTFYYVTKSIIEDSGIVKEFIIEQTAIDEFNIIYVSERELTRNETDKMEQALTTYLEEGLQLNFKRESVLDRSRRGKLKQFISYL
jgi:phenylacetate-CoA ligase